VIKLWGSGEVVVQRDPNAPHEDHWLQLNCDRADHYLGWGPTWNYPESIRETVNWYRAYHEGSQAPALTDSQIDKYGKAWIDAGND
jgi:CDP-glucose 4,6-dehydratase